MVDRSAQGPDFKAEQSSTDCITVRGRQVCAYVGNCPNSFGAPETALSLPGMSQLHNPSFAHTYTQRQTRTFDFSDLVSIMAPRLFPRDFSAPTMTLRMTPLPGNVSFARHGCYDTQGPITLKREHAATAPYPRCGPPFSQPRRKGLCTGYQFLAPPPYHHDVFSNNSTGEKGDGTGICIFTGK